MGSINEHIIRDFSVGQEKAFRILYEKYAPALRYFAAKYVLEGKKHEEIAEILQITVNTVKKHKNNANHYMRERLKHILSLLVLCQFP